MKIKLLTSIILMTVTINAHAGLFDKKLKVYQCTSSDEAYSCSNSCKRINVEVDFTIDKRANKVLMNIYHDGKDDRSVMLDSCFVFDNKNFKCGVGHQSLGYDMFSFEDRTLKNGKYVSIFTSSASQYLNHFTCTKWESIEKRSV